VNLWGAFFVGSRAWHQSGVKTTGHYSWGSNLGTRGVLNLGGGANRDGGPPSGKFLNAFFLETISAVGAALPVNRCRGVLDLFAWSWVPEDTSHRGSLS